ncbi:hypothetical protein K2X92_04915, partial [Candidatus Gracilibacteria bacterium]|nr:hypothetical protein [Candidatus Gracilibacteria bacterium]
MESILNRLAWFVSLLFGITLCILFFGGSSYYSFFDEGFSMLFWGCILGTFIKFFFFSSDFLNSAVKKYSNNVDSNVNSIVAETTIETKTSTEKQTSYVDSIISENTIASKEEKVLPILPVIEKIVPDEPSQFSIWLHAFFADR